MPWLGCFLGCFFLWALDSLWLKPWALQTLYFEPHTLWPGVLSLNLQQNTGIAFSWLHFLPPWVLTLNSCLLVMGLLAFGRSKTLGLKPWQRGVIGLIAGGALSNLSDRLIYGGVIDYIEVFNGAFAVFNVSDIFITTGLTLLGFSLVLRYGQEES